MDNTTSAPSNKHLHATPPTISSYKLSTITAEIATIIWYDVSNDSKNGKGSSLQEPPSPAPSSPSSMHDVSLCMEKVKPSNELQLLCGNIIQRTCTPAPEVFTALFYLRKFRMSGRKIDKKDTDNTNAVVVDNKMWMLRSAFIACIQLANKMLCDNVLSSRSWSKVTGVPKAGCTILETMMVKALRWDMMVKPEQFCEWVEVISQYTRTGLLEHDIIKDLYSFSGYELTYGFLVDENRRRVEDDRSVTVATTGRVGRRTCGPNDLVESTHPIPEYPSATVCYNECGSSMTVYNVGNVPNDSPTGNMAITPQSMASSTLSYNTKTPQVSNTVYGQNIPNYGTRQQSSDGLSPNRYSSLPRFVKGASYGSQVGNINNNNINNNACNAMMIETPSPSSSIRNSFNASGRRANTTVNMTCHTGKNF